VDARNPLLHACARTVPTNGVPTVGPSHVDLAIFRWPTRVFGAYSVALTQSVSMTRRFAATAVALLVLLSGAQPALAVANHTEGTVSYITNSSTATVSIKDGTSNLLSTDRVQTGNLPS
jgi:hypothetical protein